LLGAVAIVDGASVDLDAAFVVALGVFTVFAAFLVVDVAFLTVVGFALDRAAVDFCLAGVSVGTSDSGASTFLGRPLLRGGAITSIVVMCSHSQECFDLLNASHVRRVSLTCFVEQLGKNRSETATLYWRFENMEIALILSCGIEGTSSTSLPHVIVLQAHLESFTQSRIC
jgi:hypothetical protein